MAESGAARMAQDQRQLLMSAVGLAVASGISYAALSGRRVSLVLLALAVVALVGFAAGGGIGRGVSLILTLGSRAVGMMVSAAAVVLMYAIVIGGIGGLVRACGVNRLDRDFAACRRKATMLSDVPPLSAGGFRRQS